MTHALALAEDRLDISVIVEMGQTRNGPCGLACLWFIWTRRPIIRSFSFHQQLIQTQHSNGQL